MKVHYASRRREKVCTNHASLLKEFKDKTLADDVYVRLIQLHDFANLRDLKHLKSANLHPLKGGRKYELAIDVAPWGKRGKWRIIFEQANGENVADDRMNDKKFETVTEITVLEISEHYMK